MAGLGHRLSLRLKPADVIRLGGPVQWNCSDVKFSLAYLSVDELQSPMRERIEAVPTRLTLEADQVDVAIQGAREARSRFVACAHICGIGSRQAAVKTGEGLAAVSTPSRLLCAASDEHSTRKAAAVICSRLEDTKFHQMKARPIQRLSADEHDPRGAFPPPRARCRPPAATTIA